METKEQIRQTAENINRKLAEKIYTDEPIVIIASQMKTYTPPEIIEMRKFARKNLGFESSHMFYAQGKMMENYTDDCEYDSEFVCYYPTYQSMNDRQLRGYFTWRTKVRNGIIYKTSLSYVYVYIYELINMIGCSEPKEAYIKLKAFTDIYGSLDSRINTYAKLWKRDFVVYHGLDRAFIEASDDMQAEASVNTLMNYKEHSKREVFETLNSLSPYSLGTSRFGKAHYDDAVEIMYGVFHKLSEYYAKKRSRSLCESLFGMVYSSGYNMFKYAVFYESRKHPDCVYTLNDLNGFVCKDGKWTCRRLLKYSGKNKRLGDMLKGTDYLLREKYGMRSQLKPLQISSFMKKLVEDEADSYLKAKKEREKPKIEIDLSKLQSIRETAQTIQSKLITEEEVLEEEPKTAEKAMPEAENGVLNANEKAFVKQIMAKGDYQSEAKKTGMMVSVMAESINEKLYDTFGDTVIVFDGDCPCVIEDYEEELKGMTE